MASVCVLTLCGLPAAGKTTFASSFTDYLHQADTPPMNESGVAENQNFSNSLSYRVIHIDYDELIPGEVKVCLMDDSEQFTVSEWKLYRKVILRCIDNFLGRLSGYTLHETVDDLSDMCTVIHNKISPVFSNLYDGLNTSMRHGAVVLVIDDNMYYSSMRYQVYQLARKYSTGYAQIYFPVDVKEALERNTHRNFPVADDVIVSMSSKIDVPSAQNSWEALTTEWTAEDYSQQNFCKVVTLIEQALHNPVTLVTDNLESERQESRSVSCKSLLHQSDCILRHLMTDFVTTLKTEVTDSAEISERAKEANGVRQRILEELRQQMLIVPQSATDCLKQTEDVPTSTNHPLYIFIKQIFTERLKKS